ncbi:MAG: hypothetical protein ABH803_04550 [Candidatus Micrarchaeota archaeon]
MRDSKKYSFWKLLLLLIFVVFFAFWFQINSPAPVSSGVLDSCLNEERVLSSFEIPSGVVYAESVICRENGQNQSITFTTNHSNSYFALLMVFPKALADSASKITAGVSYEILLEDPVILLKMKLTASPGYVATYVFTPTYSSKIPFLFGIEDARSWSSEELVVLSNYLSVLASAQEEPNALFLMKIQDAINKKDLSSVGELMAPIERTNEYVLRERYYEIPFYLQSNGTVNETIPLDLLYPVETTAQGSLLGSELFILDETIDKNTFTVLDHYPEYNNVTLFIDSSKLVFNYTSLLLKPIFLELAVTFTNNLADYNKTTNLLLFPLVGVLEERKVSSCSEVYSVVQNEAVSLLNLASVEGSVRKLLLLKTGVSDKEEELLPVLDRSEASSEIPAFLVKSSCAAAMFSSTTILNADLLSNSPVSFDPGKEDSSLLVDFVATCSKNSVCSLKIGYYDFNEVIE